MSSEREQPIDSGGCGALSLLAGEDVIDDVIVVVDRVLFFFFFLEDDGAGRIPDDAGTCCPPLE